MQTSICTLVLPLHAAAPDPAPRAEYEPPPRPYLPAQASGGAGNLSYLSRPQSAEPRAPSRLSSSGEHPACMCVCVCVLQSTRDGSGVCVCVCFASRLFCEWHVRVADPGFRSSSADRRGAACGSGPDALCTRWQRP